MPDAKARHAAAQRRHAARLKARGLPRQDDLARALFAAARSCLADRPVKGDRKTWALLLDGARKELLARGFADDAAWPRLRQALGLPDPDGRSEEHTSELQSLMRISYAVF